jgi:gamma-glutamyl hercynylcysteine S-oxide hydrolase
MCRHLAYLGPPATLADVVLHQPHSLVRQSYAPTDMRGGGTVNADGFGIGWLDGVPGEGGIARRYRRAVPMWSDASLPDLAASVCSGGMPVTESACAPFAAGASMFSHNGVIIGWPASVAPLADALPSMDLMTMDAPTDSAFLWALVRDHLRDGRTGASALAGVVGDVLALAPGSRLNLLLNDGVHIAATTAGHALWVRDGDGSLIVSSEALDPDDKRWQPVPDLSLLEATTDSYTIQAHDEGWS